MNRRRFLYGSTATAIAGPIAATLLPSLAQAQDAAAPGPDEPAPQPFSFEDVIRVAADIATRDYAAPNSTLVGTFEKLGYDQYRGIRFRRDRDPWKDNGVFGLDLLPPGMLFKEAVAINLVKDGVVTPLPFDPLVFDYHSEGFPNGVDSQNIGQMGWSGFRLRTPLNRPDYLDEFAVFQGASYFRAVARNTIYGQSARGLAIGTGSAQGEEFPIFREFWIHEPRARDRGILVQALLDSPSVSGAYEFYIMPGNSTVISTRVALFPRKELADVGVAPLTSMYWFGPADRTRVDDYRPAVHDTDGLQMMTGSGNQLWRVLSSHSALQLSSFMDENPQGFGLIQRDRRFASYEDAEAHYEMRPSAWIAPNGLWGRGSVALVEIPVENEFNDNIVSFWRPGAPLAAGQRYDFSYDLTFAPLAPEQEPVARVRRTMSGAAINTPKNRVYMIDFDLGVFGEDEPVAAITASAGKVLHPYIVKLREEGVMRLAFEFAAEGAPLAELTAVLNGPNGKLSETWLSRWTED